MVGLVVSKKKPLETHYLLRRRSWVADDALGR
jgi:hypothetical protein